MGVAQPTIFKLIHSSKKGSAHLHKIARVLGTTPAYLSGEVDDPEHEAPPPPLLTPAEARLVDIHRGLNAPSRAALMHVGETMLLGVQVATPSEIYPFSAAPGGGPPAEDGGARPVTLPPEYVLADMFRGLLASMPDETGDELSRELAKLLPTALARLKGPFRYEASDDAGGGDVSAGGRDAAPRGRRRA